MRENGSRLNKKTFSLLLAIVLMVTAIGRDVFFVQAESAENAPVVTVGESGEQAPAVTEITSELDGEEAVGAARNVTAEVEQLGLGITALQHGTGGSWSNIGMTGTNIDLSTLDPGDDFKMTVSFNLLKGCTNPNTDIEERTIREGDYFEIVLPELFKIGSKTGTIKDGSNTIANYIIDAATRKITVTFTDFVNKEKDGGHYDIWGEADFQFNLNQDKLKQGATTPAELTIGTTTYTFILPKKGEAPTIKGVEKKMVSYDEATREITWEIKVGTDSKCKGLSLNGVYVEDTLPVDYLESTPLTYSVSGDTAQNITVQDTNKFQYTFPSSGTIYYAPTTITVKGKLKSAIFTGNLTGDTGSGPLADVTVSNNVLAKVSENGMTIGTANTAKVIKRRMLSKLGEQSSATKNKWKITVNEDENPIYYAKITDPLDMHIKLVAGSVKINGVAYTPGTPQNGILVSYAGTHDSDSTQSDDLVIEFQSPFHDKKVIEFETEIKGTGQLTDVTEIANSAAIEWKIPEGNGPGPERTWGIPGISVSYNKTMVTKNVSFNKESGELTWTIHPSTRFTNNTQVWFEDTIEADQTFVPGSLSVTIGGSPATSVSSANNDFNGTAGHNKIYLTSDENATDEQINTAEVIYKTKTANYGDNQSHTYSNTVKFHTDSGYVQDTASQPVNNNVLEKSANTTWVEGAENPMQMKYTIDVNKQKMNLSNPGHDLIIRDNVSNLFTKDGETVSDYTIVRDTFVVKKNGSNQSIALEDAAGEPAAGHAYYDGTNIIVNLGDDTGTAAYEIIFYAAIHKEVFENDFGTGVSLNSVNTASVSGGNIVGTVSVTSPGSAENQIGNKLVQKTASNYHDNKVDWTVIIDEHAAGLTRPLTIIDSLSSVNAEFDMDSIELYMAAHSTDGKVSGTAGTPLTDGVETSVSQNADGTSSLVVHITREENCSYVLKYSTIIMGPLDSLTNNVRISAAGVEKSSQTISEAVDEHSSGGSTTRCSIAVHKSDGDDSTITVSGATFGLYRTASATAPSKTAVTDANGYLKFGALITNRDYWIQEMIPPEGYALPDPNPKILVHTGTAGGSITHQYVTNKRKTGSVTLKKVNENDETLTGAKFKLYYQNGAATVSGVKLSAGAFDSYVAEGNATEITVTGSDGLLTIPNFPIGSYYFVETESPTGYSTPDTHFTFDIVNSGSGTYVNYGSEFHIKNGVPTIGEVINRKAVIHIHKVDSADSTTGLTGAKFCIEVQNGATWTEAKPEFTMASETIGLGDLPYGKTYRIVETAAPEGYLTPSGNAAIVAQFALDGSGAVSVVSGNYTAGTFTFTVSNTAAHADVKLMKKDADGNPLQGVLFSLYQKRGSVPDTTVDTLIESGLTTDAAGILSKTNLKGGNYYFVETATVSSCILDSTPVEFSIHQGNDGTVIQLEKTNQFTEVKFDKTDKKGVLLSGAVMRLSDAAGNIIKDFTTTGTTEVLRGLCVCGETYTLMEIKAPRGYKKAKPITFTMDAAGRVIIDGAVQTGNSIRMIDAKLVVENSSDDDSTGGTHHTTQTPSVPGVTKTTTPANTAALAMLAAGAPNTGDDSPWLYYLLAMAGALLAGAGAFWLIRKDAKKRQES